ncbi:hypothetical protein L2D08_12295 [Domibacillus sp. PGB-M46]|uniref:hypothetical protein n=1 Tax=Domibacillus sp. PGB-M46 TaxID=2910255 RepID=UPI001F58DC75|nr:hypothetical protein [Domibacillus sp. PGB-M46]MCI2255145.1 hypothetical protein [Domibacillus sp. PGB-M46]
MDGMIGVQTAPLSMGQALSPASPGGSSGLRCSSVAKGLTTKSYRADKDVSFCLKKKMSIHSLLIDLQHHLSALF